MTGDDPFDLDSLWRPRAYVAVSIYTVVAAVTLWWFDGLPTVVRIPLALPLVVFAPGYTVIGAVFQPGQRSRPRTSTDVLSDGANESVPEDGNQRVQLSALEGVTLAVLSTIAIVPMVALAVNALVGVQLGPVLAGLTVVTVVAASVSVLRETGSGRIDSEPRRDSGRTRLLSAVTSGVTPLALVLIVALLAMSGVHALTAGGDNAPRTEFYISNESNATESAGEDRTFDLRVEQHGDDRKQYTVVVVSWRANGTQTADEIDRFGTTVPPDSTVSETVQVDVSRAESDSTLSFLLYRGDAPRVPDATEAHRVLRVSIDETS